jgi:hypothetical protein
MWSEGGSARHRWNPEPRTTRSFNAFNFFFIKVIISRNFFISETVWGRSVREHQNGHGKKWSDFIVLLKRRTKNAQRHRQLSDGGDGPKQHQNL